MNIVFQQSLKFRCKLNRFSTYLESCKSNRLNMLRYSCKLCLVVSCIVFDIFFVASVKISIHIPSTPYTPSSPQPSPAWGSKIIFVESLWLHHTNN